MKTQLYSASLSSGEEVTTGISRMVRGEFRTPIYIGRPGFPKSYDLHSEIELGLSGSAQQAAVDAIAANVEAAVKQEAAS